VVCCANLTLLNLSKCYPSEEGGAASDAQWCCSKLIDTVVSPTSRFRASIVLLLLILINWKLWLWNGLEWHIIQADIHENRASDVERAFGEP
jgi:hypothetical protein